MQTQITHLLQVLQTRGLPLTDTTRTRITTCRDNATLDRWFLRALTATTTDEAFTTTPDTTEENRNDRCGS